MNEPVSLPTPRVDLHHNAARPHPTAAAEVGPLSLLPHHGDVVVPGGRVLAGVHRYCKCKCNIFSPFYHSVSLLCMVSLDLREGDNRLFVLQFFQNLKKN